VTKSELWREWWMRKHGKNMPMGGYHPMEGHMYDSWDAGYEAGLTQCEKEINHLKAQLMRANTNDGAYKAAYLAGQLSAKELIK